MLSTQKKSGLILMICLLCLSLNVSQGASQDLKAEFDSYCRIAQELQHNPSFLWIQKRLEYQKQIQTQIQSDVGKEFIKVVIQNIFTLKEKEIFRFFQYALPRQYKQPSWSCPAFRRLYADSPPFISQNVPSLPLPVWTNASPFILIQKSQDQMWINGKQTQALQTDLTKHLKAHWQDQRKKQTDLLHPPSPLWVVLGLDPSTPYDEFLNLVDELDLYQDLKFALLVQHPSQGSPYSPERIKILNSKSYGLLRFYFQSKAKHKMVDQFKSLNSGKKMVKLKFLGVKQEKNEGLMIDGYPIQSQADETLEFIHIHLKKQSIDVFHNQKHMISSYDVSLPLKELDQYQSHPSDSQKLGNTRLNKEALFQQNIYKLPFKTLYKNLQKPYVFIFSLQVDPSLSLGAVLEFYKIFLNLPEFNRTLKAINLDKMPSVHHVPLWFLNRPPYVPPSKIKLNLESLL